MQKNSIIIHIPRHLAKFILKKYNIISRVELSSKYTFNLTSHPCRPINYFERQKKEGRELELIMWNPSLNKAYTFCQTLEREFSNDLLIFTKGFIRNGFLASDAIKAFLDEYNIYEQDFKYETAYKKWVRRDKKKFEPLPLLNPINFEQHVTSD